MTNKEKKYKRGVIEVTDFLFANPMAKRKDILEKFGKKWQTSTRVIDRIWKEAKESNKNYLIAQEKVKDSVLSEKAKEGAKRALFTKLDIEEKLKEKYERLEKIKYGAVFAKIHQKTREIIGYNQCLFGDEIRSIEAQRGILADLRKMNGWDAPTKTEFDGIIKIEYE
jgi:hypothetical protein